MGVVAQTVSSWNQTITRLQKLVLQICIHRARTVGDVLLIRLRNVPTAPFWGFSKVEHRNKLTS